LRLISWNVAGRVRGVPEQAAALTEQHSDVIALQEIRVTSLPAWRAELEGRGYAHVLSSLDGHDPAVRLDPARRLGVLVASRTPLAPAPEPEIPWHERVLAVTVEGIELLNLHAPISTKPDQVKVRTLEAVFEHLAAASERPRVFVGDLNTPQYESREGEVSSFARTRSGRIRPAYGERHDAAELSVVVGLLDHGYVDAFRVVHGYGRRDRSWMYAHAKMGYRLDHVLVRGLAVEGCDYRHDLRERGLSDHSAIWAQVGPPSV
jgi:exonuclease III